MSNSNTPKPGEKLKQLKKMVENITDLSSYFHTDPSHANRYEDTLKFIPEKIGNDPDSYKFLIDQLTNNAAFFLSDSDKLLERSVLISHAVDELEKHLINHMEQLKVESIEGETWHFKKVEDRPDLIIDRKNLPTEYFMQISVPDEAKIQISVSTNKEIPGVEVKKKQKLIPSVIKKEQLEDEIHD